MLKFLDILEHCKQKGQTKILKHISNAQPFVFSVFKEETMATTINVNDNEPLDLPFKICSFELLEDRSFFYEIEGTQYYFLAIIVEEIEPQKIIFYALGYFGDDNLKLMWVHPDDDGKWLWLLLKNSVQECLLRLKNEIHGFNSPRTIFKWKDQGEKKQVRINKVIYVKGHKESYFENSAQKNIQWSHAFWVMGHWRTIQGIGKDRDGNYVIKGKTWVTAFVKNAELGDPVTKIRFHKEGQS